MKRVQIHGPGDLRIDDVPEPHIGPNDVLLEVGACGICGTDVGYARVGGVTAPVSEPMPLGHELAGTVVEVGDEVGNKVGNKVGDKAGNKAGDEVGDQVEALMPGMRVAVNPTIAGFAIGNGGPEGAFCNRLLVRDAGLGRNLFPIPDEMPFELGALAEPLGVGMNAVNQVQVKPGDKVAVMGAGPIGLAAVATLLDRGIEDIVSIDLSQTRLEVAQKLGVPETLNPSHEDIWEELGRLHGRTPHYGEQLPQTDVFIEASGAASVLSQIIERAGPRTRVSVVALHRQAIEVNFMTVMMKQMTLQGAMEYPDRFEDMIELLGRRDLRPMITHRFRLEEFHEAFAIAQSPDRGAKVMIEIA
ncbi:MAG: alcohol dehydrogenase catalytic domain-containing protein [Deltaproteobacteria bacterium]|nr:alcohol dehydrogenase catalytic domain-containing protein [Deltaproteobacteria bacterium]